MAETLEVKYRRESAEVHHFFIQARAIPEVTINKTGIPKEEMSNDHYGGRFLCLAALACFTSTMGNALVRNGANLKSLTAKAIITKDKDSVMRTRFQHMLIELDADMDDKDREIFNEVKDDMERGSLVTYSLSEGIEMDYVMRMNGAE